MDEYEDTSRRLESLASDLADVLSDVDATTEGQYGPGIGSEAEEEQVRLLFEALESRTGGYQDIKREVPYPGQQASCDVRLDSGLPIEAKLLRYWRANGDPEPHWFTHVFSPFNSNTLLTDARRLATANFDGPAGLLGLFYNRATDDPTRVEGLSERFNPAFLAEKVCEDASFWYNLDVEVCGIASFDGLRHEIHQQGAVITWVVAPVPDG